MKHKKSLFNRIAAVITILFFVLSFGFIGYRIFLLHQAEKAGTANPFSTTRTDEGTSVSVISGDNPEKSIKKENPAAVLEDGSTVYTASVIAVGDNLYHKSVINSGWRESGEPDYKEMYEYVRDAVQEADLAIVDQETVLTDNFAAASGYPRFSTPIQAADALVDTGFDVVYSATNHADDYGEESLLYTVNYWKTNYPDITLLGIHDSPEDADTIRIREVNGIRIAFLEYTYGTNSLGFEGDKSYLLDVFSDGSAKISEMIRRARNEADCVIFIAHWGLEDEPMPTEFEKQWAAFLMRQGVDVCIGGHPHNLQPYGFLSDNDGHRMLVFYSLGNFISNMDKMLELLEGMGCFTIQKTVQPDGSSSVEILDPVVRPMVMHFDYTRSYFRVYFLDDYSDELAQQHWLSLKGAFTLRHLQRKFEEIMSINVKPSTGATMLNVRQLWDGTLLDPQGNVVPRPDSESEFEYYYQMGIDIRNINTDYDYTAGYQDGGSHG